MYTLNPFKYGRTTHRSRSSKAGNGQLEVNSSTGEQRIYLGSSKEGNGFFIQGYNKTGERVVQLKADDYGNGYVGSFDRYGKGKGLMHRP